jgi:hypothetical protein
VEVRNGTIKIAHTCPKSTEGTCIPASHIQEMAEEESWDPNELNQGCRQERVLVGCDDSLVAILVHLRYDAGKD